jgi:hypothetical protein
MSTRSSSDGDALNLDKLELHDAVLKAVEFDLARQTAVIKLDCYLKPQASTRTPMRLQFKGVQEVTCTADWDQLKSNSKAGNVNYWLPNKGAKPKFIYLNDGCITVRATGIRLLPGDSL